MIEKRKQRDEYTLQQRIRGFFGAQCQSMLSAEHLGEEHHCTMSLGHPERHGDGKVQWGYGDNWLESTEW